MEKQPTTFRLTDKAKDLLARLAEELGMSQGAVLESLIREKARKEGVSSEEPGA